MPEHDSDALALQRAFAQHLRDPDRHPPPSGLEDRRLQIYRDLFLNNVLSLLAGTFPVLRTLYDEAGWRMLVRQWYATHRAQTPLFPELGREFVRWLQQRADDARGIPAWQAELAHYEWMEVVAGNSEIDLCDGPAVIDGDLLSGRPVLSPLTWPLLYRWPVQRIRADALPTDSPPAQPTCLVIVRDRRDQVGFLEANPLTLRLVELLGTTPRRTGSDLLRQLAGEAGLDAARLIEHGRDLLQRLRERDIVLGIQPDAEPARQATHPQ